MAVYTTRIVAESFTGQTDARVYTVPVGRRVVVRDILVTTSSPGGDLYIYIKIPGDPNQTLVYLQGELIIAEHWELRQALHVADEIWVYSSYGSVTVLITAYDFSEV